jgi:phosphoribosylformylglycinamidine (FGAM) synthase-like enzyme
MKNQQHLFIALANIAVAAARNTSLKKYKESCLFVMGCDGEMLTAAIFAGARHHIEKHFFNIMCAEPEIAVCIKKALDRAMAEPEIFEKITALQQADGVDDLIRGALNSEE